MAHRRSDQYSNFASGRQSDSHIRAATQRDTHSTRTHRYARRRFSHAGTHRHRRCVAKGRGAYLYRHYSAEDCDRYASAQSYGNIHSNADHATHGDADSATYSDRHTRDSTRAVALTGTHIHARSNRHLNGRTDGTVACHSR
jgi:hypothetical protein